MRLSTLTLRHFRNLRDQELELPEEGVALVGDNAQGKSNFLEAIYYLETFRSFRGARDMQMLRFGADVFRIVGRTETVETDGRRGAEVAAAFQKEGKRKKVTIDGTEPERLGDALGHLSAVIFSPADIDLVSGGPSERRRFLDVVLSLNEPGYLDALRRYRRSLARRNASLKAGDAASLVSVWDDGLVRAGSEVIVVRRAWIEDRSPGFGAYYSRVSAGESALMTYRSSVPLPGDLGLEATTAAFREALRETTERERRLGVTVVGPHRDEVRLQLEDEDDTLDLRDYGSGGQRRTAALALRLVEAGTIRDRRSRRPLILLDDVFAELDGGRSERILELLDTDETGQVVLTAPRESDVRLRGDRLPRWRIRAGEICA